MGEIPIRPICVFDGDLAAAWESATAAGEPILVPAEVYVDERGWSIMNQFRHVLRPDGQINYSVIYPGVVKAWHRHREQTDFWLCLHGHVKVGVHHDEGRSWQAVIGERRPAVVVIPPLLWHGAATVGHEPSGLLYYVTKAYDPDNPDEQRRPCDAVPGFPWGVRHA